MTTEEPTLSASTTSTLDKPLHQLTEDDISQITREQCRLYLKQKGMRRPSWNKSQAIQQVIMLKALLEPSPDSDGCRRKFHITHRQQETPTTRIQKGTSADTEISASADQSDIPGDNDFVLHGISGATNEANEQITIFYSGKVNVYDDIPAEKLAASPLEFPQIDGNVTKNIVTYHFQAPNTTLTADSSAKFLQIAGEGSGSRKASIQRYREKRKDR